MQKLTKVKRCLADECSVNKDRTVLSKKWFLLSKNKCYWHQFTTFDLKCVDKTVSFRVGWHFADTIKATQQQLKIEKEIELHSDAPLKHCMKKSSPGASFPARSSSQIAFHFDSRGTILFRSTLDVGSSTADQHVTCSWRLPWIRRQD